MRPLVETQLEVLLARDAAGRLTCTRDPVPRPAPRVFLGRSAEGNVWALHRELAPEISAELERLCSAEPALPQPRAEQPPLCRDAARALLSPVRAEYRGPCYVLPDDLPCDARARVIEPGERSAFSEAFAWVADEFAEIAPVAIAFESGSPAAVCFSARGRTDHAAEAGLETLRPYRRRGLGTSAAACWARAVQRSGRLALYSASWENEASLRVARRLSGRLYGEDWHLS